MKKMAMVLACVMLLTVLAISSESNATVLNPGWYNVIINSSGALTSNLFFLFATSTLATPAWPGQRLFLMDGANPACKALLAAGLTGVANGAGALYLPTTIAANTYVTGVGAGTVQ